MRLALGFNPVFPVREMTKLALGAEAKGYESIWIHESLYQRDVITYLASILSSTKRIKAASGAINTFTRHPVTTATTFANLSGALGGARHPRPGVGELPNDPAHRLQDIPRERDEAPQEDEGVRQGPSGSLVGAEGQLQGERLHGQRPRARLQDDPPGPPLPRVALPHDAEVRRQVGGRRDPLAHPRDGRGDGADGRLRQGGRGRREQEGREGLVHDDEPGP